jgi:hypothetical protein
VLEIQTNQRGTTFPIQWSRDGRERCQS